MVNRNSPSKFKSNEVDAAMPVSSEGLRTTDETGIGQRIRRTADNDETLTINLFPGQFIRGIFLYWPELLVILLVKFLLCYFGILTGLIERCSYFARDLCPKYWPELLVTPLVNLLLCYEPFPTGVKQRDQPATIDFAMAALNSDINIWKEVPDTFISVTQGCQARKGSSCDQACLTSLRHEVGTISRLERSAIKSTLKNGYVITQEVQLNGILTGLKRDIERCSYFTRDLCPKFNPISASAEFFLYFNRAFRPKLFYSNGSLHSTIPLLAGNGIDDLSDSLGSDWAFSLLQDLNFLKEAIDTHSSLHQASKECSCQAYIACLMQATVSMSLSTSSLRYLETRRYISISKEAPDISSSWHPACFACFMPDAGNIPHLEGCLNLFESQKTFGQLFYGPFSLATQAR